MSIEEIKQLNINERIALVEEIWDSIEQEQVKLEISEYEKHILDMRQKALEDNPDDLITWDEIKAKL
jgi:putative addiction module component (TIGR02574 family)